MGQVSLVIGCHEHVNICLNKKIVKYLFKIMFLPILNIWMYIYPLNVLPKINQISFCMKGICIIYFPILFLPSMFLSFFKLQVCFFV